VPAPIAGQARGNFLPEIEQVSVLGEMRFQPSSVNPTPDGGIDVGGFAPGTYAIATRNPEGGNGRGIGWARGSHAQEQARLFTIGKDAPRSIPLQANSLAPDAKAGAATGDLTGSVAAGGKASAGTMLLLVAATPPDANGRLKVHRQQSNTDGSFTFERIPLGNYILVAIEGGWGSSWTDPATLSAYLAKGTPVQLTRTMTMPRAVEAQSKN